MGGGHGYQSEFEELPRVRSSANSEPLRVSTNRVGLPVPEAESEHLLRQPIYRRVSAGRGERMLRCACIEGTEGAYLRAYLSCPCIAILSFYECFWSAWSTFA